MAEEVQPDMSCVPYRRKGLYFLLTIPFLLLLVAVFVYLWTFSFVLSLVLALFYGMTCLFQAYCCAYQDCPYVGGFCPAVAGIMPASLLAKLLYGRGRITKSKKMFETQATFGVIGLLGMAFSPVFWIAKLGLLFAIGYVAYHVVNYVVFLFTICPACAIRHTCPGGKLLGVFGKE
jgi:hypothetical protein